MNHTTNYQLSQWEASDRILMSDFNSDNAKIDAALKANADAAASTPWVKLVETLEEETQKWDIDLSGIDLTKYQKLVLYPRLKGNTDQWVYMHINGLTSGYSSPNNDATSCGNVSMMNDNGRQNFGFCEYTFLVELPRIYIVQVGATSRGSLPTMRGYLCPALGSGVTHIDTLNLWFNDSSYHLLPGSTAQIYGFRQ